MASLYRSSVARNARTFTRIHLKVVPTRATTALLARFNSSQAPRSGIPPTTPEKLKVKEDLERKDDLRRDWDAVILSYEDLVPITEAPTPDTYLLDVREPDEVIQGMIPSAVNLPLSVLSDSLHLTPAAFKEKHGYDKPKKDQRLIFYCRSGMRSTSASDIAKRNGFKNILNYKGSWLEWVDKQNLNKHSA